jgi:hypothetical protein
MYISYLICDIFESFLRCTRIFPFAERLVSHTFSTICIVESIDRTGPGFRRPIPVPVWKGHREPDWIGRSNFYTDTNSDF